MGVCFLGILQAVCTSTPRSSDLNKELYFAASLKNTKCSVLREEEKVLHFSGNISTMISSAVHDVWNFMRTSAKQVLPDIFRRQIL